MEASVTSGQDLEPIWAVPALDDRRSCIATTGGEPQAAAPTPRAGPASRPPLSLLNQKTHRPSSAAGATSSRLPLAPYRPCTSPGCPATEGKWAFRATSGGRRSAMAAKCSVLIKYAHVCSS